ncbi:hypothetical protein KNU78_gp90 [Gordonia phage Sukkupi]|uniref:Uncharacterized protein n=1 Tax=Gordonia phage Sukkupi TaxID=2653747 RepID=A0A5Q2WKH0_9CAUD|nr:hypothetical protein KNU78_gp90 [Gordonia phage Sukkupi]QGH79336.1 hypothetical protein SEA_SUKKUPI_90 [Gordonia phage Sukkupi]QGH80809.1 hypothetical protein SEA_YNDEXA_90 [Gordonia phage Yndexa]
MPYRAQNRNMIAAVRHPGHTAGVPCCLPTCHGRRHRVTSVSARHTAAHVERIEP